MLWDPKITNFRPVIIYPSRGWRSGWKSSICYAKSKKRLVREKTGAEMAVDCTIWYSVNSCNASERCFALVCRSLWWRWKDLCTVCRVHKLCAFVAELASCPKELKSLAATFPYFWKLWLIKKGCLASCSYYAVLWCLLHRSNYSFTILRHLLFVHQYWSIDLANYL